MNIRRASRRSAVAALIATFLLSTIGVLAVAADTAPQSLPFAQDWTNTGLITADDDWAGVPGIVGYRGDSLTASTGTDPQTLLADNLVVDVIANQTNPDTFTTGGVAEFDIADPVVALQGSGTADAPYLTVDLNTTGQTDINVAYTLRDVDGSADNAVQPVALQYRVGTSGAYTNVPAGFVADATTGPSLATLVTPVSVAAPGRRGQPADRPGPRHHDRTPSATTSGSASTTSPSPARRRRHGARGRSRRRPRTAPTDVAVDANVARHLQRAGRRRRHLVHDLVRSSREPTPPRCRRPDDVHARPGRDFASGETCTVTVVAANVTDQDTNDPPDTMTANHVFGFTTVASRRRRRRRARSSSARSTAAAATPARRSRTTSSSSTTAPARRSAWPAGRCSTRRRPARPGRSRR